MLERRQLEWHAVLQWNAKFFYNSSTHEKILTIPTVDKLKHKWLYLQSLLKRHKDCWPIFPFVQKQGSATESRSVSQCALESSQGWTPGSGVHFHEKQAAVCCKIIAVFAFVSQTFHRVFKRTISEQLSNQIKLIFYVTCIFSSFKKALKINFSKCNLFCDLYNWVHKDFLS